MPLENDFLPFAVGSSANVLDAADYAALTTLSTGWVAGVAKSQEVNTIVRKASIMAAMLANFIIDNSGQPAVDDGTTATLEANLKTSIQNIILAHAYAPLASPALTGTPTAPTVSGGTDNSTAIATTAFVQAVQTAIRTWANGLFASQADLHGNYSTTSAMESWVAANFANLNSPFLVGTPSCPTAPPGTDSGQLANTAFCQALASVIQSWTITNFQSNLGYTTAMFAGTPGATGYLIHPSGVMIQWGVATGSTATVNFYPTNFRNGVALLVGSDQGNPNTGTSSVHSVTVQPIIGSLNQFKAFGNDASGAPAATNIAYVAIGW